MDKKRSNLACIGKVALIALLIMALFGCEPISVSVNAAGDIAFARAEGVFVLEAKTGKLITVNWNQGQTGVPVIVRWSPDNETLAYTSKPSKDSQAAEVYVVKKSGGIARQLLNVDKVVTQMEWSPDGKYLSLAQQGEDSELGAADLVLLDPASGMSKVVVKSASDIHAWLDNSTLAFVKIASKNSKNSDVLTGKLSTLRVDSGELRALADVKINTALGLDVNPATRTIAFSALAVGAAALEFIPSQLSIEQFEVTIPDALYDQDQKDLLAASYASDKKSYRLKKGLDQETQDKIYDALASASLIDASKTWCWLAKVPDAKGAEVKPEKLDMPPADFLQFSPDGANLLAKTKQGEGYELGSWNLAAKGYKTLVSPVTDGVSANSSSVKVNPCWQDNKNVVYFRENRVYGSNGLALTLMLLDTGTLKSRNLQPGIDSEINKLVEAKGGY